MRKLKVFDYILLVGITFYIQQVHGSQECTLKTYITDESGSSQEIQDFCLEEFITDDCKQFVGTFNWTDLPEGFPLEPGQDFPVEEPDENLAHLEGYYYTHQSQDYSYFLPGMTLTFGSPPTETSRNAVKGYLMISERLEPDSEEVAKLVCRMFKVNNTDKVLLQQNLKFSYTIESLSSNAPYRLRLYTMPPPDSLSKSKDEEYFVEMQSTSGSWFNIDDLDPDNWSPTVTAKYSQDGSIEVAISHAPEVLQLNKFEVMLLKSPDVNYAWRSLLYDGKFAEEELSGHVIFDKVPSGTYKIVVDVIDTFAGPNESCSCYQTIDGEKECSSCLSVGTEWFNFTSRYIEQTATQTLILPTTATITTPTTKDEDDIAVTISTTEDDGVKTGLAIGLSCAGLVLVVIAAVVVLKFCHRPRQKYGDNFDPASPDPSTRPVPGIGKKKVYMVYAEDHQAHALVVEKLAHFLQVHCCCDVIFPPWENIHGEGGPAIWSRQIFSRADYILFVDSEAMEKLLKSYTNNHVYTRTEVSQCLTHKLLQEASRQVFNNPDIRDKMIAAYLSDRCNCQGYVLAPHVFHIPKQIPDLLKCIHHLSSMHANANAHSLPLHVENFSQLPEGLNLEQALKASRKFERDKPNWFRERFGEMRPVLQTVVSKQSDKSHDSVGSGESGIFSTQGSVSSQDISQLGRQDDSYSLSCHEVDPNSPNGFIQLDPMALCNAGAAGNHRQETEENRSVFTIGTNILNRSSPSEAPSSVIPPECYSLGASTTFSGQVRRFNTDNSDPSDIITQFTADGGGETSVFGTCDQVAEPGSKEEESRSQFERSLISPFLPGRSDEDDCDGFERHIAAFNDFDEEEEDEERDLSGILIIDQSQQPDTVSI